VTGVDSKTAQDALLMAMAAIDAETFLRRSAVAPRQPASSLQDCPLR